MNPAILLRRRRELLDAGSINPNEVREIVALELMTKISQEEISKGVVKVESPREYYLTLYSQCLQILSGEDVEDVLDDDD